MSRADPVDLCGSLPDQRLGIVIKKPDGSLYFSVDSHPLAKVTCT